MKTNSPRELASYLKAAVPQGLIAIDGYAGVGKTTLSRALSYFLDYNCVHLDFYLAPGTRFLPDLNLPIIANALRLRPVIVEGACVLAVLDRLGLNPDFLIYVHTPTTGEETPEKTNYIADEIRAYHAKWTPISRAHCIYLRQLSDDEDAMSASRADIEIAYINAKTRLAIMLAAGGMVTLIVGLVVLLYGVTGSDHTLIKLLSVEVSATGLGGVILSTSAVWAFLAYQCRPKYSQLRQSTERYGADGNILERHNYEASTQEIRPPVQMPEHRAARKISDSS